MNNDVKIIGERVFLILKGDFEGRNAAAVRDALIECLDHGHRDLTVDLSDIEVMNATGLGVLVSLRQRIDKIGGRMTLCGIHGEIRRLFERTRLIRVFTITEDKSKLLTET